MEPNPREPSLGLSDRDGIPEEIAYLRERFPTQDWATHPNYGELAAFWRQVHGQLRREGAAVHRQLQAFREEPGSAGEFRAVFGASLEHHLGHLDLHHRVEDQVYFPRFRALDPRMVKGFDLLERDHEVIHQRLEGVVESANELLRAIGGDTDRMRRAADAHAVRADALLKLLDQHLDDEEDLVIPALLEHGERAVS